MAAAGDSDDEAGMDAVLASKKLMFEPQIDRGEEAKTGIKSNCGAEDTAQSGCRPPRLSALLLFGRVAW